MNNHQQGNNERSTFKLLVGLFLDWYEGILVFCHVIAVSLDPLFFYVPVIKEDKRCIELNNVLWTIAIVLRSVTDVVYLVHFVVKSVVKSKIRKERNDESNSKEHSDESRVKGRRYFWPFFMLNILVILPIPQVLMSKILSEMRRAKYTNYVTILNAVILSQYVPRVLQIYISLKELGKNKIIPIRIRASFNFFLYILAGYIFGAFWYFFTTQRLTYCWRKACLYHGGCVQGSFNCDHSFRNFSVSHDFCSIDTTNTRAFDFGIFLEARQSGILESTDFPKKLIYTAWWGLRNLSSFGSNLQTSACIWENAFAFGISMLGLLLFLYLLGNLQVYMQRSASKNVENSENNDKKLDSDDAGFEKSLKELRQLYMQRSASKYVENSENNDKKLDSDDAGFEKLLKELGELYKQRGASKSPENSERVQNFESPDTV